METSLAKQIYHLPWIIWAVIITILSLIPGDQLPVFEFKLISIDSLVHVLMYLGLTHFLLLGFHFSAYRKKKVNLFLPQLYLTLISVGFIFGASIELIQGEFIPKRFFAYDDIVANGIGAIFGGLSYLLMCRKLIKT